MAGRIKARFETRGFDVFMAHDDLEPSVEWQDEILRHLGACEVFLALLTQAFDDSNWAHQEIGIACAKSPVRPVMVPINAGRGPVGFLAKYQAIRVDPDKAEERGYLDDACVRIVRSILKHKAIADEIRSTLVDGIESIDTYDDAGAVFRLLQEINGLKPDEIDRILAASSENPQVYESRSAYPAIRELIETHKRKINKTRLNAFYKVWRYAPGEE